MSDAAALRALIFDVDGTLAETERDGHRVAFNQAFRDLGLDWHWDAALYRELLAVAGGRERIEHFLRVHRQEFRAPGDREAFLARVHAAKTARFARLVAGQGLALRPGVRRLLGEARAAGLRLAIATTASAAAVAALLRACLGAEPDAVFDAIGSGECVPRKKPAPDVYEWVLARLGLAPSQCIAIEDSAPGLAAARAAGIATLVTASDMTRDHDFTGALAVLSDLGEPQAPFTLLAGAAHGARWADVAALQRWLAAATV